MIPFVTQFIGEEGELVANEVMDNAADSMLDELARVGAELRPLQSI